MENSPHNHDAPPPPISEKLDRLCDRFEELVRQGIRPDVEALLAEAEPGERDTLRREFALIRAAYSQRNAKSKIDPKDTTLDLTPDSVRDVLAAKPRDPEETWGDSTDVSSAAKGATKGEPGLAGDAPRVEVAGQVTLVATTWPFSELPSDLIRRVVDKMYEVRFAAGETLLRQGESCPHLLVLMGGETEVRVAHGGESRDIAETHGATILGEMSLLTGESCSATVDAITEVRALALAADDFEKLAARHHALWLALGLLTAERLGRRSIDILADKEISGFRIRRCVGRGGMAMVYEAARLADGERVALKMLSHRLSHNLEAQSRFEREVNICRTLNHPNIARVYESFTAFGTNFMVVGFCEGETLAQVIHRDGPLDEPRIRRILGQLAAALAYAHSQGVCHRDLKPANVMVDDAGNVKLMDFGLAKTAHDVELTSSGHVMGTPRYMPPEQLTGSEVDHRSDYYTLGCTAYEMITGRPLFEQGDPLAILSEKLKWQLPPRDQIREGLDLDLYRLLLNTMARQPEDRRLDLEEVAEWADAT